MKCHYCETTENIRPYGPRCAMVCYSCAFATPEREAETTRNLHAQIEACGNIVVIDGSSAGPYPLMKGTQ